MAKPRSDILVFGGIGVLAFALQFWIQFHWLEVAACLMGRDRIVFDEQPSWIRGLDTSLSVFPWLVCLALLIFALRRRRWIPLLAFGTAQILGWAAVIALLLGRPVVKDYASRVPFDSAQWRAENLDGAKGLRVQMVDDLLRRHTLRGMSRTKVDELLGVPPDTQYFSEYDYVYWLGQERGAIAIDSEWLVLKFQDDVVTEAAVVRD